MSLQPQNIVGFNTDRSLLRTQSHQKDLPLRRSFLVGLLLDREYSFQIIHGSCFSTHTHTHTHTTKERTPYGICFQCPLKYVCLSCFIAESKKHIGKVLSDLQCVLENIPPPTQLIVVSVGRLHLWPLRVASLAAADVFLHDHHIPGFPALVSVLSSPLHGLLLINKVRSPTFSKKMQSSHTPALWSSPAPFYPSSLNVWILNSPKWLQAAED